MLLNKLTELLEYEVDNMQYNRQQERETVDESELYDVDFKIYPEKMTLQMIGIAIIALILITIKGFAGELYDLIVSHQTPELNIIQWFLLGLSACGLMGSLIALGVLWLWRPVHVEHSKLICKGKTYHCRDITEVCIDSLKVVRVYAGKRKIMTITVEYVNYSGFLSWAEKCHIPIQKKESKK